MDLNHYSMDDNKYNRPFTMMDPLSEVTVKSEQQNVAIETIIPDVRWNNEHPYMEDPKVIYVDEFIVIHSLINNEKILCVICNAEFETIKEAQKHSKMHKHSPSDSIKIKQQSSWPRKCPSCDEQFNDQSSISKHLSTVHKTTKSEKSFTCDICYKSFSQPAHLSNHSLVHTGIRNYICTVCDKKFKQRGHLLNHLKIHSNERNYKCVDCGKSFRQTAHLKTHVKIHKGIKDYACIVCNKVFTQSGQLQTHMRTHTNIRKYACHLCDKSFKQSGHLQVHVKRHEKKLLMEEKEENTPLKIMMKKIKKISKHK